MTLACQTLWFFQTCLSAVLSYFTWCLARNRKNKRELYTPFYRVFPNHPVHLVCWPMFSISFLLSLSISWAQGSWHFWLNSKSLFFDEPKIEVAIVKSYLWYHTQKSLLNVHRKHIHNGSCNASFLPENTLQFVQSTWSHLCFKQYSITQMLTNEQRWQRTKRKKNIFILSHSFLWLLFRCNKNHSIYGMDTDQMCEGFYFSLPTSKQQTAHLIKERQKTQTWITLKRPLYLLLQ